MNSVEKCSKPPVNNAGDVYHNTCGSYFMMTTRGEWLALNTGKLTSQGILLKRLPNNSCIKLEVNQ